ncbi:LOW QUALITY PROTEIN: bone marrow proteoglycan [Lagenorhynchus albirostris]|uniref:LOW QUALITY PROTEIN: bone marrow proteoglycan n=1 Tax=Lagenorhynchus albirostris TaxID=27610 RepID=UPI0028ED632D|nr:LOW QUALITY PROTEIN: bone marrow proteoglycan [Lagenorhynchus albirostris]
MKLHLLLALLLGTVSAFHLRTEMSNIESPLGDDTLPQVGEVPESEAKEIPVEGLLEEEEDRGSGSEDAPREEGAVESISALDEVDRDLQCPKDEDTVKLEGIPGCKTCRFLLLTCQRCYRGRLISIHNFSLNHQIQCLVRQIDQGQVWSGCQVTGREATGVELPVAWVSRSSVPTELDLPGQAPPIPSPPAPSNKIVFLKLISFSSHH